jgi:hypothetical protein
VVSRGCAAPRSAFAAAVFLVLIACGGPKPADFTAATAQAFIEARGFTATPEDLVRAVAGDALDVAAALLALGVSADALDGRPVAIAARSGYVEMLRLLLDAGADPNRVGPQSQSPLAFAVMHRHDEAIEVLLAAGADPNGKAGAHPLLFAVDTGTAERLLDAGASADARDANGGTALTGAVMLGDAAMVDLLLEHGADVDATDKAGRPALLYATVAQFEEIRERLLAAGADPLPGHEIARASYTSFLGRYGTPEGLQYEIVADPGRLLLIEPSPAGQLYASELAPLSATRFYRVNDPGAAVFEMRVEGGLVTGLARMQSTTWEVFERIGKTASDGASGR